MSSAVQHVHPPGHGRAPHPGRALHRDDQPARHGETPCEAEHGDARARAVLGIGERDVRWRRSTRSASTNRVSATRPGSLPTAPSCPVWPARAPPCPPPPRAVPMGRTHSTSSRFSVMTREPPGQRRSSPRSSAVHRVGQLADGEIVDAGRGDSAGVREASARRRPPARAAGPASRAPPPRVLRRRRSCRAAPAPRRRRAPRRAASSVSTSTSHGRSGAAAPDGGERRGRPTPAAATWLSLISTASPRPMRWLTPPPQRTAYFSSSAQARASSCGCRGCGAGVPATASTQRRGGRRDAGEVAQQVQRGPLGGEQAADRRADGERGVARGRARSPSARGARARRPSRAAARRRAPPRRPGSPASTPGARGGERRDRHASAGTVAAVVTSTPSRRSSASGGRDDAAQVVRVEARSPERRASSPAATGAPARHRARSAQLMRPPAARPSTPRPRSPGVEPHRALRARRRRARGSRVRPWQPRLSVRVPRGGEHGLGEQGQRRRPRRPSGRSARRSAVAASHGVRRPRRVRAASRPIPAARVIARLHDGARRDRHRRSVRRRRRPAGRGRGTAASSTAAARRPARRPRGPPSRLLDASRLAPCTPVHATSPTAYSPGTAVRPSRSARTPPHA